MAILDLLRGRRAQEQQQPQQFDTDTPSKFPQFTIFSRPGSSLGDDSSTPSSGIATPIEEKQLTKLGPCPEIGRLASWKGALILLVTSGSQFLDNVFMTSANVALSSIQENFDVSDTNLQWMISAYTLTFGGFLLLAGVLSDRYVPCPLETISFTKLTIDFLIQVWSQVDPLSGSKLALPLDPGHWLRPIIHPTHSLPRSAGHGSCAHCAFSDRNHQLLLQWA